MNTKRYHSEKQEADRTGYSARQFSQWRQDGNGPPYIKVGRKVLYDVAAVDDWLAAHTVNSTSEAAVRDAGAAQ